jgi:hypothetical protein
VWAIWTGVTVAPGPYHLLTTTQDYTGAETLRVAIECPSSVNLKPVGIGVWWAVPNSNFTATDAILASGFLLQNMGGAVTQVYGNQLQLQVINTGSSPISCDQVTAYAVVH